ncbi:MAG: histidine kinase [Verrucomicrobia bacterium]|nr:MAG: histidine kinase [Verrucomicrobiota bacterium]
MAMGMNQDNEAGHSDSQRVLLSLYRIGRLASRARFPDEALSVIIDELVDLFEADRASICLINPDTNLLEPEITRGYLEGEIEGSMDPGRGSSGWVAFHNRSLLVSDFTAPGNPHSGPNGIRCRMTVPMEDNGQVLGVINLDRLEPDSFDQHDLERLETVRDEVTAVLQRLWVMAHLNIKANQLEVLINIGQSLVTKLELDELLSSVARETQEISRSQLCTIQLYQPETDKVSLRASHPTGNSETSPAELDINDSLASAAIRTRRQVEFRRLQSADFSEVADIPTDPTIQSVLSTPILLDGNVIGVIHIFTDDIHRFANEEKRLLSALASLAAVAIQNTRLYSRVFESEESLRRNEKLTTLGLLAAEIAHEIRNPLTVLKLLFGSLNLEFAKDDPRSTDVSIIQEKLNQLESIVGRVLSFAKAPGSLHARWNIDEIVRETCLLVRLKLHQSKIHMHYHPPSAPLIVDANKGQIQQVLLNLLLNATEAMPRGGNVTIRCSEERENQVCLAVIEIEDTGGGIPDSVQPKLFSSFLSGRTDGTGLGLAIVKRIMQSHHGDIEVIRSDPRGTAMKLSMPAV